MIALATPDESLLLSRLVAGEEEPFVSLRAQLGRGRVVARTESELGILIEFAIPDDAPRAAPRRFELSDVEFALVGTEGRGFATLWVDGGVVTYLELGSDGADWRLGTGITDVAWSRLVEPDGDDGELRFEPADERDWEQVRRTLAEQADGQDGSDAGDNAGPWGASELAMRPQGTIALPLLVPLARILDAAVPADGARDDARAGARAADQLAADLRLEQPAALETVAALGGAVLEALPGLIDPSIAAEWLGVPDVDLPVESLLRRWKAWTARERPAPVVAAIAAVLLASGREHGLLDPSVRALARELFHHARQSGLLGWADAHAHAQAWWKGEGAEASVWALAVRSLVVRLDDLEAADEPAGREPGIPAATPRPAPHHEPHDHHSREVSKLRDELHQARAEAQRLRHDAEQRRLESEQLRAVRSQLRARVRELEEASGPLREECDRLERYARALQALLAEEKAAAAAGSPDQIPDPPPDGWPADLLANLMIVLCTGQDRAAARMAMADELRLAGAEVIVHEANAKMPDRFPPGALVVCDVRFVGHAAADRVRAAAVRSGTRVLEVRAGQGGIVRAVAVGSGRMELP